MREFGPSWCWTIAGAAFDFGVTIAGFWSSLAGAGVVSGFAAPFHTIAGTSIRTGFFFRGGRL
jgi:hypothetical protein